MTGKTCLGVSDIQLVFNLLILYEINTHNICILYIYKIHTQNIYKLAYEFVSLDINSRFNPGPLSTYKHNEEQLVVFLGGDSEPLSLLNIKRPINKWKA